MLQFQEQVKYWVLCRECLSAIHNHSTNAINATKNTPNYLGWSSPFIDTSSTVTHIIMLFLQCVPLTKCIAATLLFVSSTEMYTNFEVCFQLLGQILQVPILPCCGSLLHSEDCNRWSPLFKWQMEKDTKCWLCQYLPENMNEWTKTKYPFTHPLIK